MKILSLFSTSFLCAFVAAFAVMLIATRFDHHAFKPFVAVGVAAGIGLASAFREGLQLSPNAFAVLVGILAALGSMAGGWLSNG